MTKDMTKSRSMMLETVGVTDDPRVTALNIAIASDDKFDVADAVAKLFSTDGGISTMIFSAIEKMGNHPATIISSARIVVADGRTIKSNFCEHDRQSDSVAAFEQAQYVVADGCVVKAPGLNIEEPYRMDLADGTPDCLARYLADHAYGLID